MYFRENQKGTVVFRGDVARELLRRGYTIIDIKPDKRNPICTVFVFRIENNITQLIWELTQDKNISA